MCLCTSLPPTLSAGAVGGLAPGIRAAYDRPAADGAEDDSGDSRGGAVGGTDDSRTLEELMAAMKSL